MNENVKFKITTDKINLLFSGTDEFVSRNIKEFKNEIESIFKKIDQIDQEVGSSLKTKTNLSTKNNTNLNSNSTDSYPNVLHFEENGIFKILPKIDKNFGKTNAKKVRSVSLIFLWAKHIQEVKEVDTKELRKYCEDQKTLKLSHFSHDIASATKYFVSTGTKGSSKKSIKLSTPGIDAAKKLLSKLNEEGNS